MSNHSGNAFYLIEKFEKLFTKTDGCWIWNGDRNPKGYGIVAYGGRKNKKREGAHRVAFKHYVGNIPAGLQVLHKCDNPSCVNPEHLFVGTQLDNIKDMFLKKRQGKTGAKGEKNGKSVFSAEQVIFMRQLYADGVSVLELNNKFGATYQAIDSIVKQETWKHI